MVGLLLRSLTTTEDKAVLIPEDSLRAKAKWVIKIKRGLKYECALQF